MLALGTGPGLGGSFQPAVAVPCGSVYAGKFKMQSAGTCQLGVLKPFCNNTGNRFE